MRRVSVLFVPGSDPGKIERARRAGADTLVLDLEDAVPPAQKAEARACVVEALRAGGFEGSEPAVRINPPGTPFFEDDLAALAAADLGALMLPKAERPDDVREVGARLRADTRLLLLLESPRGVADALALGASPRADALCFGHADFSLQMGLAAADPSNDVVHHARCQVAIAAKANGLAPIDCVHLAVKDEAAFRADAALGLSLGYEGKLCIHPRQVEWVNEIYTPSAEQIEYARRVIEGWNAAQREGSGVCILDGKMVDAPLVTQQQRLLARVGRAEAGSAS